jgi:hypothetical protein
MNLSQLIESSESPIDPLEAPASKTLAMLESYADRPRKRTSKINPASETVVKGVLQTITATLLESGLDAAKVLLDTVMLQFHTLLTLISQASDPLEMVFNLITIFDPKNRDKPYSVARSTIDYMLPDLTRTEMDHELELQYQANLHELDQIHAKSAAVALALDDTEFQARPKDLNGAYGYVQIGQQLLWKRGLIFPAFYDLTHQQFLGCHQQDYRDSLAKNKCLLPLITEIQQKTRVIHATGSHTAQIEADRAYFQGELFAAATLNLLDLDAVENEAPRLVVPRKFTREKADYKWDYLLAENSTQVFVETIKVSQYSALIRKYRQKIQFSKDKKGDYLIPYACVCLIDEYASQDGRTFAEIQQEAHQLEDQMQQNHKDLTQAEERYCQYLTQFCSRKHPPKKPTYGRGLKRRIFHDTQDANNYHACWDLHYKDQHLKEKKTILLKAVIFFAISLQPNEIPTENPEKFIKLAQDYHSRWGIENGFKDVKHAFLRPMRSIKPTKRQYTVMIGMELYGRWHVDRIAESLTSIRAHYPKKVPWDPKRPYVRRKLEQEVPNLITARCYLIRLWGVAFEKLTKKLINQLG